MNNTQDLLLYQNEGLGQLDKCITSLVYLTLFILRDKVTDEQLGTTLGRQASFMSSIKAVLIVNTVAVVFPFCSVWFVYWARVSCWCPRRKNMEQLHSPASQVDTEFVYIRSEHLEEKKTEIMITGIRARVYTDFFIWHI